MTTSVARIEANRLNARKSTGPRTPEGKAKARANAVKHGLTGAGLALPNEDDARVQQRFLGLQAAMTPSDDLGMVLVHKVALMSVRAERAALRETAALSLKMRHAAEEFELQRLVEVDRLFDAIESDPAQVRRRLLTSTEGVDKLVGALEGVKQQLESGHSRNWDDKTRAKIEAFFGGTGTTFPTSKTNALLQAMTGDFRRLKPGESHHLADRASQRDEPREGLILLIDAELDYFATVGDAINPEILALDRLGAAERAMFDSDRDAILARKYEAAANLGFSRALAQFLDNEARFEAASDAQDEHSTDGASPITTPTLQLGEQDERRLPEADRIARTPEAKTLPASRQNEPNLAVHRGMIFPNEPNATADMAPHLMFTVGHAGRPAAPDLVNLGSR